jgi:exopolyphosphatase/guanosine-5'-triphosphate,3'-diphosphate pyrophosphatase
VRLCIYRVRDGAKAPYRKKDFKTLLNHKTMAGLAAHVAQGIMTQRGIDRAAEVIRDHMRRAEYFNCVQLDVFATAFLRNCRNSEAARAAIENAAGIPINLLSAWDEAHLGFVGAASAEANMGDGVLIDIGGGSTELTRIIGGKDCDNISIAQGSLSSFSSHVLSILPTEREMDSIAREFQQRVQADEHYRNVRCSTVYGIGGSARGVAKIYGEAFLDGKHPDVMEPAQVKRILQLYLREPEAFAHLALKAVPDRIHTAIPGCIIVAELLADFDAQQLRICKGGVREGYLIDRLLR